jgi:hypothetical protein
MPLRCVFGWQKPCYLLGEGYVKTFKELMEGTEWEKYGVGNYEKCANCMVHCGFEGTALTDSIKHPWKIVPLVARREDRRSHGARYSARQPAAGRIRVFTHVEPSYRDTGRPTPRRSRQRSSTEDPRGSRRP